MMSSSNDYLPVPPQTGRNVVPQDQESDQTGLWSQLLAVFRDFSGSFDSFANDADPSVRALGRVARQRRPQRSDDYFALGDLCARLTLQEGGLSQIYAAKTIAAYVRACEIAPGDSLGARAAIMAFVLWVVDVARTLGGYEALKVGALVCERVQQIGLVGQEPSDVERLRELEQRLREQMNRIFDSEPLPAVGDLIAAERESRLLCDQGQMLLRQNQAVNALGVFERALQADDRNHAAWLWRAMALTDLGRFDTALESYDRALALEPGSAGVWNSKGSLLMELGRVEAALECFERALELSVAVTTVKAAFWLNKGKALFILKHYQEARDALVRSHQLDPSPESAAGIAACREQLSRLETAETSKIV
jgi:tetratricopeptide (TPR) repeat protein